MIRIIDSRVLAKLHAEIDQLTTRHAAVAATVASLEIEKKQLREQVMSAEAKIFDAGLKAAGQVGAAVLTQINAEAARAEAEAKFDALAKDIAAGLVRLWDLDELDRRGTAYAVQAGIALEILRAQIAEAKASGDPEQIRSVQFLDALIGENGRAAAAEVVNSLSSGSER